MTIQSIHVGDLHGTPGMKALDEQVGTIMKDLDDHAKSISEFPPSGSSSAVDVMAEDGKIELTESKDVEEQMESTFPAEEAPATETTVFVDPFQAREGRDLVWKDVNMTLVAKGDTPERKLLDNVWGEVPKGQVTAIMGASGSGKTSMLNILAGRVKTAGAITIKADVRLNNYSVDPTNIEVRKKIAFVAQDDSLQVTATPREAIRFSARLRLPSTMTGSQIESLTNQMIGELGLQDCADTIVGGELIKGISGGERKRTSVGVELVTRPALVFLDEPTSGLDSFNAVHLCRLLKKVASTGSSVLFTIHQPSSDIFSSFDRLILLNKGRVMYQGSVQNVPTYFGDRGHPCPPNYNPADWVMHVALSNTIKELDIAGYFPKDERNLGAPFSADKKDDKDILGITERGHTSDVDSPLGLCQQTRFLFKREINHLLRNTHALKARTAMTCAISSVIGFIFFQVARLDFDSFINVQTVFGGLLMSLLANVFSTALPSLMAFPVERPVFLREYSTNHYSVFSYFGSRLFMELFVTGVQVTVSSIITYFLIGYSGAYGYFWSGLYLMACASTALGVFAGCSVENPSVAVEFLPAIFMPQIIFSGFFIPPSLMPSWLSWIRYICPLTYGIKIVVAAEFGFGRCDKYEADEENFCATIMKNTEVDVDDLWWYYLVLLSLFIVVRVFALFQLKRKADKFY
jgi:ABC-type multidrug transport system ATPase subunit/ABC-type multidrug transport system permease subunit